MQILSNPVAFEEKEKLYLSVRAREGRVYTDEEVLLLPGISLDHKHYREWVARMRSFVRFREHLIKIFKGRKLNILDVGCGNGWISNHLDAEGHCVTGLDLNLVELKQAEKVFGSSSSLEWIFADITDPAVSLEKYDVILLAASVQYFPDIKKLTGQLKTLLLAGGQIHLLDSMFYSDNEAIEARQRSFEYYTGVGFPEMAANYYHHSKTAVKALGYKKLYPAGLHIISDSAALQWWVLYC